MPTPHPQGSRSHRLQDTCATGRRHPNDPARPRPADRSSTDGGPPSVPGPRDGAPRGVPEPGRGAERTVPARHSSDPAGRSNPTARPFQRAVPGLPFRDAPARSRPPFRTVPQRSVPSAQRHASRSWVTLRSHAAGCSTDARPEHSNTPCSRSGNRSAGPLTGASDRAAAPGPRSTTGTDTRSAAANWSANRWSSRSRWARMLAGASDSRATPESTRKCGGQNRPRGDSAPEQIASGPWACPPLDGYAQSRHAARRAALATQPTRDRARCRRARQDGGVTAAHLRRPRFSVFRPHGAGP